ncbi:putative inhibitor of apoptosis [Anneissia japonica]|uniref:putative inhibitor of apoptosis n=1 Tax=Anneissia japonica TaxID=1529436 RepID=UPI00142563D1|nr:putative inhibitor of apoptosis [Anneissia japonica]XP_033105455.1 putative inhibitor of apoptosis [Anneissia japonica]XP_033105456.1 putative inhibitor of apoptosis [Anneissia japonica]XP_033105457.1 putative inhibitor of apoptosis [Anneissia japonica]XP_033105458.1 putative inhibitor of apoptosis [Anneissia japonica]
MYNFRPTNTKDLGGFLEGNTNIIGSSNECQSSATDNPKQGNMAIFATRLATFSSWPIELIISKTSLAEAGFFYTHKSDMVECYSCHGKIKDWQIGDDAFKEHKRHFPRCALVQNSVMDEDMDEVDGASVSSKYTFNQNNRTLINSQRFTAQEYQTARIVDTNKTLHHRQPPQLKRALYPQYCEASARRITFKEWKGQQIPVNLVEAGFFSVGEPDQTKCFYCGGGLRSWETNDDPWIEHAKWFPKCEWLIRKKGESFVRRVQKEFSRMQNPTNHLSDQKHQQMSPNRNQQGTSTNRQSVNKKITFEEAMKSEAVKQILEMGFDVSAVGEVVKDRLTSTGDVFKSATELIDSVIKATESPSSVTSSTQLRPKSCAESMCHDENISSGGDQLDCDVPEKLQSMIEELRDKTTCKICMDDDACIVFVPCGHLVTCLSCSPSLSLCPICRTEIKSHLQAYF